MNAMPTLHLFYGRSAQHAQRGTTLITALVMLIVLTLLVISAIRSSTTNLRIAGNMQVQEEVLAAAQQATELVLSSDFTQGLPASSIGVDINNDGVIDYWASVKTPTCSGDTPITNANIPPTMPQCLTSGKLDNSGIVFVSGVNLSGTSWCDSQQWDVGTTVSDARTGAAETIHQGVSTIVPAGTTCNVTLPAP
jgi:type II secretory pathway pseudopilin PulG